MTLEQTLREQITELEKLLSLRNARILELESRPGRLYQNYFSTPPYVVSAGAIHDPNLNTAQILDTTPTCEKK